MTTEAHLEVLSTAFDAHGRATRKVEGGDLSMDAVRAEIRAINVLFDACMDAGMSFEVSDHVGWAAERITKWLLSGAEA